VLERSVLKVGKFLILLKSFLNYVNKVGEVLASFLNP